MELTLGELHADDEVLARITEARLPIKVAHDLARTARKVSVEAKFFVDKRNALFKEYGVQVEGAEPGTLKVPSDRLEEFTAKMIELSDTKVEVDVRPIAYDLLVVKRVVEIDGKNVMVEEPAATAKDLFILGELVKEA